MNLATRFRNMPLRRKQTLIILLTSSVALLLACSGFSVYDLVTFRESLVRRLSTLAQIVGENTSAALDFNEAASAKETLSHLQAETGIVGACVYGKNGQLFVSYDRPNDNLAFTAPVTPRLGHSFERQRLVLARSIVNKGETVGVIYLESDTEELNSRLATYVGISSLVFLVSLLAALGLSSRLQGLVSNPILHLAQVARAVALDRNYSVRATKPSNDEIGQLVDGFNEMLAQIQSRDLALGAAQEGLEKRVLERTEELEKEIVERRKTEADRLKFFALVENSTDYISMAQQDGRVFYLNPAGRKMAGIALNADLASIDWRQLYDEKNWRLRCEVAIPKLLETGHWDGEIRMRSLLTGESRDLRVTGFRVDEPQTGTTLCMATVQYDITAQKEAERAITERARLLALSADIGSSLTRGVSLADMLQGCAEALVKHLEAAFARVWTLAEETQVLELMASAGLYTHLNGPHGRVPVGKFKIGLIALEKKPHLTNQVVGDPRVGDQEWAKREGMIAFAGYPLVVDDRVVGVMALFARHPLPDATLQAMAGVADNVALGIERMRTHGELQLSITNMKEAEGRLAKTHRELLEVSRLAGMAEVATGVLHNVGNVLNSVNISASMIGERIRDTKAANLEKVSAMVREHEGDLAHFLQIDSKGRQIPGYLHSLASHMAECQKDALAELKSLEKNIDHIKEIVAMQQSYAKVSGVQETVNIAELVEDALRLNVGTLERHGVAIIRDFQTDLVVTVERSKILQILVNIIRNAKYACDASDRTDNKLIRMRITGDAEWTRIAVIDNGIGIPPENLTRIFEHGFTTRKSGHGFGLHSAAIAAKEMGGTLLAQSDGLGKGAVFTLEIPNNTEAAP